MALKNLFKKVGRGVTNAGKLVVNVAASPVTKTIDLVNGKDKGQPIIGGFSKKDAKFEKFVKKTSNITGIAGLAVGGAVGAVAAAPVVGSALGLKAGAGAVGVGAKTGLFKKVGTSVSSLLKKPAVSSSLAAKSATSTPKTGLLATVKNTVKAAVNTQVAGAKSSLTSGLVNKFNSKPLVLPKKVGGTTIANTLNGNADAQAVVTSYVEKDSKLGGILSKLPTPGEVFDGALEGVKDVFGTSEAGEELKDQAKRDWWEENKLKVALYGLVGFKLVVLLFFFIKSLLKKPAKRSRRY